MNDAQHCHMNQVVSGPELGAYRDLASGEWLLPCSEPVAGLARENGRPYCSWHLELMDEPPLMWFTVTPHGVEGPFEDPEP